MKRAAILCVATWSLGAGWGPRVLAADDGKQEVEEESKPSDKSEKDDEDDDREGPFELNVPTDLRGKGFVLRVDDGDDVVLDADKVKLVNTGKRRDVELIQDGRIHKSKTTYVDKWLFEEMEPRDGRFGFFFGGTSINGDAFRKLLLDNDLSEVSFSGAWQPERWGVELQLGSLSAEKEHDYDVKARYESSQTRINGIYELTPWPNGSRFARHVHLVTRAGLFAAYHEIEIGDDVVTLEDDSSSAGLLAGVDTLYNVGSFFIGLRFYMSYQKIEFEKFDFETPAVSRSFQLGGDYVF